MTANHTIPERLVMLAAALVSLAVAAFVTARVVPVYRFLTHAEAVSGIGLLLAAGLLSLGVVLIVDWRRKRRSQTELKPWYCERSYASIEEAVADGFDPQCLQHSHSDDDYLLSDIDDDGHLISRMGKPLLDPVDELQRHLTDALAVMLRHPQLTVDAGTLRLLSRRPKPVRDERGRWRRVQ